MQDVSKDRTDYKVSKVSKTVKKFESSLHLYQKIPFTVQKALKNKVIEADDSTHQSANAITSSTLHSNVNDNQ